MNLLILLHIISVAALAEPLAPTETAARGACTSSEKWTFSSAIEESWQTEFRRFAAQNFSSARGFSEALALRRLADTEEGRVFAEYWISRALYQANLIHIAYYGFVVTAGRPVPQAALGAQVAALQCLAEIQRKNPTLTLTPEVADRLLTLADLPADSAHRPQLWGAAGVLVRELIARGRPNPELQKALELLTGGGAHEQLAQGLFAAKKGAHADTVKALTPFVSALSRPDTLDRYLDAARILLARAHYSSKDFKKASDQLKLVNKSSNDLADSLSELAWAYLMNEQHAEAVGTGMNLQTGGLRKTFAPEGPMVMAIALAELCQYPKSLESIGIFKRNYSPSFFWLKEKLSGKESKSFYSYAIGYLKKKEFIPHPVASEWIRSPLFIGRQQEINLLFKERDAVGTLARKAQLEQRQLGIDLLKFVRGLKLRYLKAKVKMGPNDTLPDDIIADLDVLKEKWAHYNRFRRAAPVWRKILATHQSRAPRIEATLMRDIDADLRLISRRMLVQLDEIAENTELVEIEIYNGASQDLIWQNANPEYKDMAQKLKASEGKDTNEKVWDWGQMSGGLDGSGEIWEDELGSFKADLVDNCTSKEKFMALRMRRSQ